MAFSIPARQEGLPIASVEQATGIARATLRIWERRYGFPQPQRDTRDERSYGPDQVEKLRLIAGLLARGHRPGRLVKLTTAELGALAGPEAGTQADAAADAGDGPVDDPVLELLRTHDVAGLVAHLEEEVRTLGLAGFAAGRMPALNRLVGTCWSTGGIQVWQEHVYTEAVQQVLRNALAGLPAAPAEARPRVLLATFPEESHGLGLLMAQALLALEGCRCTSLGVRAPVAQIVSAAAAFEADIVGLSFSAYLNPAHVLRGLEQLRGELPPRVAIWAGGSAPVLARRKIVGVRAMPDVADVPAAVAQWRAGR